MLPLTPLALPRNSQLENEPKAGQTFTDSHSTTATMNTAIKRLLSVAASNTQCHSTKGIEKLGVIAFKLNISKDVRRSLHASAGFPMLCQSAATNLAAGHVGTVDIDPFHLVDGDLKTMFEEIHQELDEELYYDSELREMSKYYFDGKGKAVRPVIAMCVGHAFNQHMGTFKENVCNQRKVAIISEMIHTASLVHDDILDHAETRRGKLSVNTKWSLQKSTMCGDYILAVGSKILAQIGNQEVVRILSQVLTDLVQGEFQQLQQADDDENERFQQYLNKSFNKTASLMTYSCQANALLSGASKDEVDAAYNYGKNIGIAFQLVDDLLDFVSSAEQLGKPAAADMKLGLATAPVLFATQQYPELNEMIARRFCEDGDVEEAFKCVIKSNGVDQTKVLAKQHCKEAIAALDPISNSNYKQALVGLCDKVLNRLN